MNIWTHRSIELANQSNYLDLLFKVYPLSLNERRELSQTSISKIIDCFYAKDDEKLITTLLDQDLFPIKYSYVSYLKHDRTAIARNPNTVKRIAGYLYDMGYEEIINNATASKETNRQIGPLFKNWIDKGTIGFPVTNNTDVFMASNNDMIFNSSDSGMEAFAKQFLGYNRKKGLDFIARVNNRYVIAEAKFITDFGGHQNAQFNDALDTLNAELNRTNCNVTKIAILDGVLYIKSNNKLHKALIGMSDSTIVLSSLLLRDFLFSL